MTMATPSRRHRRRGETLNWPFILQLVLISCALQSLWVSHFMHSRSVREANLSASDNTGSSARPATREATRSLSSPPVNPSSWNATLNPKKSTRAPLKLRFDWTSLSPISPLAVRMAQHQSNCSLPLGYFRYRNRFGLGSDLHVYSQALCNAMESGVRVHTAGPWNWWDTAACSSQSNAAKEATTLPSSAMTCYFPTSEEQCPEDSMHEIYAYNISNARGKVKKKCASVMARAGFSTADLRAAGTEFLLARVSPQIQDEALRQLNRVFATPTTTTHNSGTANSIPPDLITVHIRWGDKEQEIKLLGIAEYIRAVQDIQRQRGRSAETANVYLATEDPRAVAEFQAAALPGWKVYVDQYYHDLRSHRRDIYNGPNHMALDLAGRPGTIALGSLLVGMEANDYVLTTASNWSRLYNELRKAVVDPRCGNCTLMVDLKAGEW